MIIKNNQRVETERELGENARWKIQSREEDFRNIRGDKNVGKSDDGDDFNLKKNSFEKSDCEFIAGLNWISKRKWTFATRWGKQLLAASGR